MKNNFKSLLNLGLSVFLAILVSFSGPFASVSGINNELSSRQIVDEGGENSSMWESDGVSVSKTIDGTDTEDIFDITLQVKSKQSVEHVLRDESAAIVLVMDLSNTMTSSIDGGDAELGSGNTKAELTVNAVQNFISEFYNRSLSYIDDSIGVVGFNTDGVEIEPLTSLDSEETVNAMNSDMSNKVMSILSSYAPTGEPRRFTNIEGGLKMAKTMLDGSSNKYKYIVFLSDGLPTTYTTSEDDTNYIGKDPNVMTDKLARTLFGGTSGVTQYGTNYSNTGARRARNVATALKDSGVTVFSIGIGLSTFSGSKSKDSSYPFDYDGQESLNGQQLIMNQLSRATIAEVSTVQNGMNYTWETNSYSTSGLAGRYRIWNLNKSAIYGLNWEIARSYNEETGEYSHLPLNSDEPLFENWLKYSIGSGYYYDAVIDSGVQDAIDGVTNKINEDLALRHSEVWTTTDPMSAYDREDASSLLDYIEFQGFFNQNDELVDSLSGEHILNGENTASFVTDGVAGDGEIKWDLKHSGFTTTSEQGNTVFLYSVKYRIRLKVDAPGFVDKKDYDANGETTLSYIIKDNQGELSDNKVINYPIPVIEGYLTNLKIAKIVNGVKEGENLTDDYSTFEFTLSLKDSLNQTIANTFFYDKYDADGNPLDTNQPITDNGIFELKNHEYVIIHNLYHGIHYTISETEHNGFVSSVASGNQDGIIENESSTIDILFSNLTQRINIQKIDSVNKKPLPGATFSLYGDYQEGEYSDIVTNMNGLSLNQLVTDEDGIVELGNLDFAQNTGTTYYLKEDVTPNMYVSLDDPIELTIGAQGVSAKLNEIDLETSEKDGVYTVYVPNERGSDYVEPAEEEKEVVPKTSTLSNLPVRLAVSLGVGLMTVGVLMVSYEKFSRKRK